MKVTRGCCLCGDVSFEYRGEESWRGHCHCESCRRATSSPFTTWLGVPRKAHRFTGAAPLAYASSPGVRRLFCGRCGTPVAYESERYPDEIHLYAASLEEPASFAPQFHCHWAERLPWIEIGDTLPRYHGSSG